MNSKLHKAWAILLAPITVLLACAVFLQIALVNLSWQPARQFWRDYIGWG